MADFVRRIILVNEFRADVKGAAALKQLGSSVPQLTSGMNNVTKATNNAAKASKGLWAPMTKLRISFFNVALAAGLVVGGYKLLTKGAMDVDESVTRLASVTGETNDVLLDQVRILRRGTIFTLKEVSDAYLDVAKRGFNTADSFKVVEASTLLATGAFTDLATATNVITTSLNQFGLSANSAGMVANVLAGTAIMTAANIETLGVSLRTVGPVADAAGLSFAETSATLGLLMDSGLQASKAGTGLRAVLNKILNPSKEATDIMKDLGVSLFDVNGRIKGVDRIMSEFSTTLSEVDDDERRLDAAMTIFGIRGGPAAQALFKTYENGGETISELTAKIQTLNFASDLAAKQMESMAAIQARANASIGESLAKVGAAILEYTIGGVARSAGAWADAKAAGDEYVNSLISISQKGEEGKAVLKGYIDDQKLMALTNKQLKKALDAGAISLEQYNKHAGEEPMRFAELDLKRVVLLSKATKELTQKDSELAKKEAELTSIREFSAQSIVEMISANEDLARITGLNADKQEARKKILQDTNNVYVKAADSLNLLQQRHKEYGDELVDVGLLTKWRRELEQGGDVAEKAAKKLIAYSKAVDEVKDSVGESQNAIASLSSSFDQAQAILSDLIPTDLKWAQSIRKVSDNMRTQAAEIVNTTDATERWQKEVEGIADDFEENAFQLKYLTNEVKKYEKAISNLMKKRFTGETGVAKMIHDQETAIARADLAMMGITDAHHFLNTAQVITIDNYKTLKDSIDDVNDAVGDSQTAYDAWQQSINEHIKALIIHGSELKKDVTNSVRWQATQAVSLGLFDNAKDKSETEDEKRRRLMEDQLEKMRLANQVTYEDMHAQLGFFAQQHEDTMNGVNSDLDGAMDQLSNYWDSLEETQTELDDTTGAMTAMGAEVGSVQDILNAYDNSSMIQNFNTLTESINNAKGELVAFKSIAGKKVPGENELKLPTDKKPKPVTKEPGIGPAEVIRAIEKPEEVFPELAIKKRIVPEDKGPGLFKNILGGAIAGIGGLAGGALGTLIAPGAGTVGGTIAGGTLGAALAKKLKLFAEGGIIKQPTLGIIGEAGPEAVIPLDKANEGETGVGTTITGPITIEISGVNKDGGELAREIMTSLKSFA